MFDDKVQKFIKNSPNNWILCFEIVSKTGDIVRLSDSGKNIIVDNICYTALSSIEFVSAIFNEANSNEIILKGYFEDGGVSRQFVLDGAKISMYLYFKEKNILQKWLEYSCDEVVLDQSSFTLILHPISKNYYSIITQYYSTSCRAKFGDHRCKVKIKEFNGEECDKSFGMCCKKYDNAVNFRAEPFIPISGYFEKYAK